MARRARDIEQESRELTDFASRQTGVGGLAENRRGLSEEVVELLAGRRARSRTWVYAHPRIFDRFTPRWLVVVARDQDEIHRKLRATLSDDPFVRVIFDRRQDDERNPAWVGRSLRACGFAVVPNLELGPSSAPMGNP